MKYILIIVCCFLTVAGCADKNQEREPARKDDVSSVENPKENPKAKYDELPGVSLEVQDVLIKQNGYVLEIQFKNETDSIFVAGEEYSLMAWSGSGWVNIATEEEIAFVDIGYNLAPRSEFKNTYKLSVIYPLLQEGHYLFVAPLIYLREPGDYDRFLESVVFEIK